MMMMMMTVMMMMMVVLLHFTDYVWTLPSPSDVFMDSVDMTHILKWRPPQAPCNTTVLYSVQFQGEFELTVLNGSWLDALECQQTPQTHCDLTSDLGSDSDYNLQVRARCGSQLSPWSKLRPPFNRRDTVLMAPQMAVTVVGDALQVTFDRLPVTAVISVTVWRRDDELKAVVYTIPAEQMMLSVAALQEGAEYCVRAHTVLNSQLRSSSTDTQCVSIPDRGSEAAWKTPTAVTVAVVIAAALLLAVFWSIVLCRPDACQSYFQKDPLPHSLLQQPDWTIQIPINPEGAEPCERLHMVGSDDVSS